MASTTASASDAPRRGRGRPRRFETERVIDRAVDLFWTEGYRTTTTRCLEKGLGLSQSSLYNAFGSKRELLEAVLDRYEAMTDRELLRPLKKSRKGLNAIHDFFAALGRWVSQDSRHGCLLINLVAEDGGATSSLTERAAAFRERLREALRSALARAADAGQIEKRNLDGRADLLLGLVLGLDMAARGRALEAERERMLNAIRAQVRRWRIRAA